MVAEHEPTSRPAGPAGAQVTDVELRAMAPAEIVHAQRAGRLAELLGRRVPVEPAGQVTAEQLARMAPDEIVTAHRAGQLDELLGRRPAAAS